MGRPKGSQNKRSQMLLRKLEDEHKFFVVNELIELYGYEKQVLVSLATKIAENIEKELPVNFGFNEDEADMYNAANKNATGILTRLLAYLYPKLKATEISAGSGDKVIFNINTLPEVSQQPESNHKAQVVPIK
jgi:hypothetical protein